MGKILLVEDDNNLREIYEARLQAEGYTIIAAKDGEEALVMAKSEKPDLVISDVMMPKISGFEMLDILRNTDGLKDVKVIMLTALGQSDDQQRANRLGADHYLVKSQVTLEDIVKVTHDLLQDGTPEIAGPPLTATDTGAPLPAPAPVMPAPAAPTVGPPPVASPPAPVPTMIAPAPSPVSVMAAPAPPVPAAPLVSPPAVTLPPAPPAPVMPAPAVEPPQSPPPAPPAPEPMNASQSFAAPPPAPAVEPPAPNTGNSVAQSTAQEEASVEARIEDFVSGATSTATEPAPAEPPAMTTPTEPVPPNSPGDLTAPTNSPSGDTATASPLVMAPPAPETTAVANDDKVITDAVNNLIADTSPDAVQSEPGLSGPVVGPAAGSVTPAPATAPATNDVAGSVSVVPGPTVPTSISGNVVIANKKIINPIDSAPKTDIGTLLALEEAKEATSAPPPAPAPVVGTGQADQAGVPSAPPVPAPPAPAPPAPESSPVTPNNPLDPNSIAL